MKFYLKDHDMPKEWYNIAADLPSLPPPYLGPDGKAAPPEAFYPLFPRAVVEQEFSTKRWIKMPEEVRAMLHRWRPTPLRRAIHLEQALGTPAEIWYKDESVSPAGSHKPNTALAQCWYNKQEGITHITTETGAGQWGSSLSFAGALMGINIKVFMVKTSYEQKPYRRMMMETWGGTCIASPSTQTAAGRKFLEQDPSTPGSLGMAISEAVEAAVSDPTGKTKYALGSVMNHVLLHQTIIGLEAQKQMKQAGRKNPDVVIGCVGGGSNFAGLAFPYINDKIHGSKVEIIGAEPTSCPTMTRGVFSYDHGDTAGMTPLMAMHTLGHNFMPESIHAGGLRYHGVSPLISAALNSKLMSAVAIPQNECFAGAVLWSRTEGFIPAPESSHAIAATIREAKKAKEEGKKKVILMNLSGHGIMDLPGYARYLAGDLKDLELSQEKIDQAEAELAKFPPVR